MEGMMELDEQDVPRGKPMSIQRGESINNGKFHEAVPSDGTATHPSSIVPSQQLDSYKTFHAVANDAFHGAFPVSNSPRYLKGVVLLLRWEQDDLGVADDIAKLKDVFEHSYRFETESWLIPTHRPEAMLTKRIYDFRDHHCPNDQTPDEPRPLLIVYYGGHSERGRDNISLWRSNRGSKSTTLNWDMIQPILLGSEADVLMLLDCGYAASSAKDTLTTSRGTNEIIAACYLEATPTLVERHSFTNVLAQELQFSAVECEKLGKPLTAVGLHRAVVCDNKNTTYVPFYIRFTKFVCESIILIPSPRVESTTNNHTGKSESLSSNVPRPLDPPTRALIAVYTSKAPGNDLLKFLQDECLMPLYINRSEAVRIEAVYATNATMVLVSVPIEVWNLIPDSDSCRFVGLIRSKNLYREEVIQEMYSHQRRQSEPVFHDPFRPNHDMFLPAPQVGMEDPNYPGGFPRPAALYSPSGPSGQFPPSATGPPLLPRPKLESPPAHTELFRKPRNSARPPLSPNAVTPKELKLPSSGRKQNDQYRIAKAASKSALSPSSRKASNASKRPYVCSFIHYGCNSTFASKNEWKRHVTSQHLQLGFYRCDIGSCSGSTRQLGESSPHNDFNRKDLFTQHCRRMHKPRSPSTGTSLSKDEESFEASLEEVRQRCWTERRRPPQKSICGFCGRAFEGEQTWDNRMEHVSKHFEKGDGEEGEDEELRSWALQEGIVEKAGDGNYRLAGLKDTSSSTLTTGRENDESMQIEEG